MLFFAACSVVAAGAIADDGRDSFEEGLHNRWSAHQARSDSGSPQGLGRAWDAEHHESDYGHHRFGGHLFGGREGHNGHHGNDITVSPVPEPREDVMALSGMALLAVWVLRRRRFQGGAS
jgi:hypothetical protein